MRVPNLTTYSSARHQLGSLTSDLQDANEVVNTQKRINSISDDPIGLSQVLDLKVSLGNLDQIEKNVNMGKSWLKGVESSLDSINNLILDAKTQVGRLINASASVDERKDAMESINGIIKQMVSLGNTQVNGSYVFGGTDTDSLPFRYHDDEEPPRVSYEGNDNPFEIKTDKNTGVKVGRAGNEALWDDFVSINSTNNTIMFKEDNGHGSASEKNLTAIIPDGEYTTDSLEKAVKNALNASSSAKGYGVTYDVSFDDDDNRFSIREDGSFDGYLKTEFLWETGGEAYVNDLQTSSNIDPDDVNVNILDKTALTIGTTPPDGSAPFQLAWDGVDSWIVDNNPGYVLPSKIPGTADSVDIDLDENGSPDITLRFDKKVDKGEFVKFDIIPKTGDHSLGHEIGFNADNSTLEPPVSDNGAVFVTDLVIKPGDEIVFEEVDSAGVATLRTINLNATAADVAYTDMDVLAKKIESDMEAESAAGPNSIDYSVSYDSKTSRFKIRENGTDLDALHLRWSDNANTKSAASTLGFYSSNDSTIYPASDVALDRTVVLDSSNNRFSFQETDLAATSSPVLTGTVAAGTYRDPGALATAVQASLNGATVNAATYTVAYNAPTNDFTITDTSGNLSEFKLLWESGGEDSDYLAKSLGFEPNLDGAANLSYTSNQDPVVMKFDATNNFIEFSETDVDGHTSTTSIEIPEGEYTSQDNLAAVIQTKMREASLNSVDYAVTYDAAEDEFVFKEGGNADISSFSLNWFSGEDILSSAADMLGFTNTSDDKVQFAVSDEEVVNITIDASNNKIDFKELGKDNQGMVVGDLTASIRQKVYTSHSELAQEVEKALEAESLVKGNRVDYSVSWDSDTKKFAIKENGSSLEEFQLMWRSGENAPADQGGSGNSIGSILGFDSWDDIETPVESSREVEWGIFNTLIDLNGYLEADDTYGLERSLERIDTHFDNMTSRIADSGMKFNRLEVREKITTEVHFSMTERRSSIEDADFIESVMNLKAINTAYEASLSSTSKIMKLSLVDYL